MSASPAQVVKQVYESWMAGDIAAARELYERGVVFDWSRRQLHPLVAEGRSAAARATAEVLEPFDRTQIKIEELVEHGDRVVALVHAEGRGRASGIVADAHVGHVWTVRDGLIHRMDYYGDQAEALAAAGEAE